MLGTFKGATPKLTALDMISLTASKGTGFSIEQAMLTADILKGTISTSLNTTTLSTGAALQVVLATDLTSSLFIWKDGIDSQDSMAGTVGQNVIKGYAFFRNINGGSGILSIDSNNKAMQKEYELAGTKDVKSGIDITGAAQSTTKANFKSYDKMVEIIFNKNHFDNMKTTLADLFNNHTQAEDEEGAPIADTYTVSIDAASLKVNLENLYANCEGNLLTKIKQLKVSSKTLSIKDNADKGASIELASNDFTVENFINFCTHVLESDHSKLRVSKVVMEGWASSLDCFNQAALKGHLDAESIKSGYKNRADIVTNAAALATTTKVPMKIIAKTSEKSKITPKKITGNEVSEIFEIRKSSGKGSNFNTTVSMNEFFSSLALNDQSFFLNNNCEESRKFFFLGLLFGDDADKQSRIVSINVIPNFSLSWVSGAQTIKGFSFSSIGARIDGPILHMIQDLVSDLSASVTNPAYIPIGEDYGGDTMEDAEARGNALNTTLTKVLSTKSAVTIDEQIESINKSINVDKKLSGKQAKALSSESIGNQWFSKNINGSFDFTFATPVMSFVKGFSLKLQIIGSKWLVGPGIISIYQGIELL